MSARVERRPDRHTQTRPSRYQPAGNQGAIYKITVQGGRIYVGQTRQAPEKRARQHATKWSVVAHEVLEWCAPADMDQREQWWIEHLSSDVPSIGLNRQDWRGWKGSGSDARPHEMYGASPDAMRQCEAVRREIRESLRAEMAAEHRTEYTHELSLLESIRAGAEAVVAEAEAEAAASRTQALQARTAASRAEVDAYQSIASATASMVDCLNRIRFTEGEEQEQAFRRLEVLFSSCTVIASEFQRAAAAAIGERVVEDWSLKSRCARDFVRLVDTYPGHAWLGRGWLNHVTAEVGRRAFRCTVCETVIGEHECVPSWVKR